MRLRYGIKMLQIITDKAKPGENVTQEEYDIMVSVLKLVKDMQKLRCGALTISGAIVLSLGAGLAVKYGYDFDLGTQIQMIAIPASIGGFAANRALVKKCYRKFDEAQKMAKQLKDLSLSQMFR